MSALGIKKSLALGQPTKLNDTVVTGTGTIDFYCPVHSNSDCDFSAIFQVVGTLTSLTAALQVSLDGSTFNDLVASASFLTTSAPLKVVTPVFSGGATFRINITALTGSQDFYVAIN